MVGDAEITSPKYLGYMTWADFYSLHDGMAAEPVSHTTLRRAYDKWWSGILKFRVMGQHARCATCARLAAMRKKATSPEEKQAAAESHAAHAEKIKADRAGARG